MTRLRKTRELAAALLASALIAVPVAASYGVDTPQRDTAIPYETVTSVCPGEKFASFEDATITVHAVANARNSSADHVTMESSATTPCLISESTNGALTLQSRVSPDDSQRAQSWQQLGYDTRFNLTGFTTVYGGESASFAHGRILARDGHVPPVSDYQSVTKPGQSDRGVVGNSDPNLHGSLAIVDAGETTTVSYAFAAPGIYRLTFAGQQWRSTFGWLNSQQTLQLTVVVGPIAEPSTAPSESRDPSTPVSPGPDPVDPQPSESTPQPGGSGDPTVNPTTPPAPVDPDKPDPSAKPDPSVNPTDPGTKPTDPSTKPTGPSVKPTDPSTKPTGPSVKPTEPSARPTDPSTKPDPSVKPSEPSTPPSTQPSSSATVTIKPAPRPSETTSVSPTAKPSRPTASPKPQPTYSTPAAHDDASHENSSTTPSVRPTSDEPRRGNGDASASRDDTRSSASTSTNDRSLSRKSASSPYVSSRGPVVLPGLPTTGLAPLSGSSADQSDSANSPTPHDSDSSTAKTAPAPTHSHAPDASEYPAVQAHQDADVHAASQAWSAGASSAILGTGLAVAVGVMVAGVVLARKP